MGRLAIIIILLGVIAYLYFQPPETIKVPFPVKVETPKQKIIVEETIKETYQ